MQDLGRGSDQLQPVAEPVHQRRQGLHAIPVGARGQAHEHTVVGTQDIAAIDQTPAEVEHPVAMPLQRGAECRGLPCPAGRARPEHDRHAIEHQRRILDEDAVGERFQRV